MVPLFHCVQAARCKTAGKGARAPKPTDERIVEQDEHRGSQVEEIHVLQLHLELQILIGRPIRTLWQAPVICSGRVRNEGCGHGDVWRINAGPRKGGRGVLGEYEGCDKLTTSEKWREKGPVEHWEPRHTSPHPLELQTVGLPQEPANGPHLMAFSIRLLGIHVRGEAMALSRAQRALDRREVRSVRGA